MITADGNGPRGIAADAVLRTLARRATGLSGADVERLVREARQSARRDRRGLTWADLEQRLSASKPVRPANLRWRMALHEAGHAVARLVLELGAITLITIDGVEGGRVESEEPIPPEETEAWLSSLLVAKLAGRAAEEVFLGSCIAGSGGGPGSDLAAATSLALQMEVSLGYGADQPLLYRNAEEHSALLIYRPEIARRVNSRLEKAYAEARRLIRTHRVAVEALARTLIARDTLEGPTISAVLADLRTRMESLSPDEGADNDG